MAYLDLSIPGHAAALHTPAVIETRFTRREWTVIALAYFDKPVNLKAPGRFRRAMETLFNIRRPNAFADSRLEALRHLAVALCTDGDTQTARDAFFATGFSAGQYETLARHIATY